MPGLDNVLDFFNGVFAGNAGGPAVQARLNSLKELWPLQQGASVQPPVDAVASAPRADAALPDAAWDGSLSSQPQPLPQESTEELRPHHIIGLGDPPAQTQREFQAEALAIPAGGGIPTGVQTPPHGSTPRQSQPLEQEEAQRSWRNQRGQPYEVDQDDLLDQHVAYYLRHHPDIHAKHAIQRKTGGVYWLDGREVALEWQYAAEPGGQGFLVVVDGPLKQPFSDYMEMTENNAEYDVNSTNRSSLSMIPKDQRMSFHDQHKVYTRLEAMKVAKEQALFREKHADYVKEGREAPDDLLVKYKKTIQQKLGQQGRQSHRSSGGGAPPPPPPMTAYPYEPPPPSDMRLDAPGGGPRPPPPPPMTAYPYEQTPPSERGYDMPTGPIGGPTPQQLRNNVWQDEPADAPLFNNFGGVPFGSYSPPASYQSPGSYQSQPAFFGGPSVGGMGGQTGHQMPPRAASPAPTWQQASHSRYYGSRPS